MSENNNYDSKKIIEEIDKLENDFEGKKVNFKRFIDEPWKKKMLGLLFVIILMAIGINLIEKPLLNLENNTDYNYDEELNEDTSNTMTIEEFMNSDLKNELLTESVVDEDRVSNEELDQETVAKEKFKKEKANLTITNEGNTVNDELIIGIENKNNELVYGLSVYTVFYKSKEIVSIDMQSVNNIMANNKKYLKVLETPKDYDNYEVFISKYNYYENIFKLQNDYVTYEANIEDELIKIKIYNSGSKIENVVFTILYYDKNGKILDVDEVTDYNISKYWPGDATGYGVWDEENGTYIDYADYKVILDFAGSYK